MTKEAFCESCGMPMRSPEEYGGGNTDNHYCVHCSDEQGNLKPYEAVLKGMTQFVMKSMGIAEDIALKTAKENMAKMPAWKVIK